MQSDTLHRPPLKLEYMHRIRVECASSFYTATALNLLCGGGIKLDWPVGIEERRALVGFACIQEAAERTCMEACRLTHSRDDCGVLNGLLGMCGVGIRHLKKTEGVTE